MSAPAVPVIVVGVDGSTGSRDAVRWAAEYARLAGGELRAVASWRWPNYITRIPPGVDLPADTARTLHEASVAIKLGLEPFFQQSFDQNMLCSIQFRRRDR